MPSKAIKVYSFSSNPLIILAYVPTINEQSLLEILLNSNKLKDDIGNTVTCLARTGRAEPQWIQLSSLCSEVLDNFFQQNLRNTTRHPLKTDFEFRQPFLARQLFLHNQNIPTKIISQCILSSIQIELNEVCVFKLRVNMFEDDRDYSLNQFQLRCELTHVDGHEHKVLESYVGCIVGTAAHEYLQVDFYEIIPFQVTGSVHCCVYKYEFTDKEGNSVEMMTCCTQMGRQNRKEILNYLLADGEQCFKGLRSVAQQIGGVAGLDVSPCKGVIDISEIETELGEESPRMHDVKWNLPKNMIVIKEKGVLRHKRRKIFINDNEGNIYHMEEQTLHKNAQKIYYMWKGFVPGLLTAYAEKYLKDLARCYQHKLHKKVGESIASFKGCRDTDLYYNEEKERIKMAYQLRNRNIVEDMENNEFPVYNASFFSNKRPIFFQETSPGVEKQPGRPGRPGREWLIILVHGLGASRLDMEKLKIEIRRYYDERVKLYTSSANEGRTEGDINDMGARLATEIDYELSKYLAPPKVCLMGHSMGGLIIRSALPRLEKHKDSFHSLITFSSPHVGYAYSTSKLVDAGLWIMNAMKKCPSIMQMTMTDSNVIEECFLYKLAGVKGLEWFSKITLLASHQDLYVPFYSARIQKHEEISKDARTGVAKGRYYCGMIDRLLNRIEGSITRIDVNFCIPEQNFDNLIGRAAHISFITNVEMLRMFVLAAENLIF